MTKRKLLYHRGIDDEVGTYITDYVEAAMCFVFGSHLLMKTLLQSPPSIKTRSKNTIAVVIIEYSMGAGALMAGIVHQFLQQVEQYVDWTSDWRWVIIWRVGSSFAALEIFGLIWIGQQILTEEKVLSLSTKKGKLFLWTPLTLFTSGIFVYCIAMLAHPTNPWNLQITFICVYLGSLVSLVMILVATVLGKRKLDRNNKDKDTTKSKNKNTERPYKYLWHRKDLSLHISAPISFLVAGLVHQILASTGCNKSEESPEIHDCPLPPEFNHNSVLHLMLMVTMTIYFVAELQAIKRRTFLLEEVDKTVKVETVS